MIKRRSVLALMMEVAETSEKSAICTRRSISEDTFKQNINSSLDENYLSDSIFPQVFKNITKYEYRLHETIFFTFIKHKITPTHEVRNAESVHTRTSIFK